MKPQNDERFKCLKGVSRKWLLLMNGLFGIIGFFVMSVSIFNAVQQGDIAVGLGQAGIVGGMVSGAFLMLISIMGCWAVIYRNKLLLFIYLFLSLIMTAVVLGSGITIFFFIDDLNNVEGGDSDDIIDQVESQINDSIIAVFNQCCTTDGEFGFTDAADQPIIKLTACNDPEPSEACFVFVEDYEAALERVKSTGLCNILKNTEVDGNPVVGDPKINPASCANGNGDVFKAVFTELIEDQLEPIGGAFIGLGSLLLLNLIANICVLCANRRQYVDMEDYDENGMPYYGADSLANGSSNPQFQQQQYVSPYNNGPSKNYY